MYIVSIKNKNGQDETKPFATDDINVIIDCIKSTDNKDCIVIVDSISVR